jgi:hypothetical protein
VSSVKKAAWLRLWTAGSRAGIDPSMTTALAYGASASSTSRVNDGKQGRDKVGDHDACEPRHAGAEGRVVRTLVVESKHAAGEAPRREAMGDELLRIIIDFICFAFCVATGD